MSGSVRTVACSSSVELFEVIDYKSQPKWAIAAFWLTFLFTEKS